jgi:hypothetical protein
MPSTQQAMNAAADGAWRGLAQLEVTFDSLAMWEQFLSHIPAQEHRAWSQRAQHVIIDGSPRWEIYRSCAVIVDSAAAQQTTAVERMMPAVAAPPQQVPAHPVPLPHCSPQHAALCVCLPAIRTFHRHTAVVLAPAPVPSLGLEGFHTP